MRRTVCTHDEIRPTRQPPRLMDLVRKFGGYDKITARGLDRMGQGNRRLPSRRRQGRAVAQAGRRHCSNDATRGLDLTRGEITP